jgi:hypothetical protein
MRTTCVESSPDARGAIADRWTRTFLPLTNLPPNDGATGDDVLRQKTGTHPILEAPSTTA